MIAPRSTFSQPSIGRFGQRRRSVRARRKAVTPEQSRFRAWLFDRAGTYDDFLTNPRFSSPSQGRAAELAQAIVQLDRRLAETRTEVGALGPQQSMSIELHSDPNGPPSASAVHFFGVHEAVAAFTRELFKGAVGIRREADPDFPCDYFVVWAVANGDVDQLVALNDTWHRAIRDVAGDLAEHYRLSLDVQ